MNKKLLLISFSGGRTSAYMLWWLMNKWENRNDYHKVVLFANTGKEHEGTLQFVERCSTEWNIPIIWVESVPRTNKGWGVTYKVVDFKTASRNGEPYEAMLSKLGIPSSKQPFCSYQLKTAAMRSYLKSIGWKTFYTAIGIRIDEVDRVNENYRKSRFMYPLISLNPTSKKEVTIWWGKQPFDLNIPVGMGNCDNCWKKSMKTLATNARNFPETFDWWKQMEDKYGYMQTRQMTQDLKPPFRFYRGNNSVDDIFEMSTIELEQLELFAKEERLDGCSESCEAF